MQTTVQTISDTPETFQDVEYRPDSVDASTSVGDIKPIDEVGALESLGINDNPEVMPEQDRENLGEMTTYIKSILKSRGVEATRANFESTLNNVKTEMGLDPNTEPSIVLDRIAGVARAWKDMSFIKNPQEKRALFMKLARQPDSKAMNRLVFETIIPKDDIAYPIF